MSARTKLGGSLLLLSIAGPMAAFAQTPAAAPATPPAAGMTARPAPGDVPAAARGADYKIGPEDVLDVAVWNNPAMSRTTPVRPDGMISLPLLNDVQAAGLTPMELRDTIAKKLTEYLPNPEVSVIVREVNQYKISILGEVKKPGRYDFKGEPSVLDAIAMAGGLSDFAARSKIVILRTAGGATRRIPVNYNKIVSASADQDDVRLRPGDVVVVP
jgi:polysaccharide biosynthesis/export protein